MIERRPRWLAASVAGACLAALLLSGCPRRSGLENQAEVHLYAAQTYLRDGQPRLALDELEKARELVPEYPKTHLLLGVAYANSGRFADAIPKYRYVTEQQPENEKAWLFWGQALYRMGRLAESVPKLQRANELDPKSGYVRGELAVALSALGRHDDAVAAFDAMAVLGHEPSPKTRLAWGTSLTAVGRTEEARSQFESILAQEPDNLGTLSLLGTLLEGSEDLAERKRAVTLHERALKARPDDAAALHNLGRAYLAAGQPGEAFDLIQRSLALTDPSDRFYQARKDNLERARAGLPRRDAAANAPNVLLVVLDTLRADHLSSYGYPRKTSPNLDALADRGVLFEHAISQAPWTAASMASLFTSLYPSVHGLDGGIRWGGKKTQAGDLPFATQKTLAPGQLTLAELLRRNGYRTAGFVSNVYVNSIFGFSQGFETYGDDHGDYSGDVGRAKRRAHETNEQVFAWLEQGDLEEPFFLFVHYNDCHWPYDPPAPYGREWVADYQGELTPDRTTAIVEQQGKQITGLSDEDLRYLIGLYDGEIAYVDAAVGKLLGKVRAAAGERDLLTVVTADHGEEFLDHGSASHGYTLFEEQIRVPLIFHLPERLAPRRVAAQVRSIDVTPSILDLAGVGERPTSFQGESLVALLTGATDRGPETAYSEATYVGEQKSLRTADQLKLIYRAEDDGARLYDLARDPKEAVDVAPDRAAAASDLRTRIQDWAAANEDLRTRLYAGDTEQEVILDDETQERLRALGYIQ